MLNRSNGPRRPGGDNATEVLRGAHPEPATEQVTPRHPEPAAQRVGKEPAAPDGDQRSDGDGRSNGAATDPQGGGAKRGAATEVPTGGGPTGAPPKGPPPQPRRAGRWVGEHYVIEKYLGEGTFGRVYLATDQRDGKLVVVKALRSEAPAAMGDKELQALRDDLGHPQIVVLLEWIKPAEEDREASLYLILEHLSGSGLDEEIDLAVDLGTQEVAHREIPRLLRRVRGVLDGVAKVHRRHHAIVDLKPAHIRAVDKTDPEGPVKLIDFGAVAPFGPAFGRELYHSPGYSDPRLADDGPSVASDVYTIGRTILVAATGCNPGAERGIPDATIFDRCPSLRRLIARATAARPEDRFCSADELAAALDVVMQRLTSVLEPRRDNQRSMSSAHFTWSGREAGTRPPLDRLVPGREPEQDALTAAEVLETLPDPDDAALTDPSRGPEAQNIGLRSRAIRDHLTRGDDFAASQDTRLLAEADPRGWRAAWFRGVLALRAGRLVDARAAFEKVADLLPGDLAPEFALAACHELLGEYPVAGLGYDQVWRADARRTAAAFGAARACTRAGAAEEAARVLTETSLPQARRGAARVLLTPAAGAELPSQRFARAHAVLVGGSNEVDLEQRVEFLLVAWAWLRTHGEARPPVDFLGVALQDGPVRDALSTALRDLARQRNGARSAELIDLANLVRRPTWW